MLLLVLYPGGVNAVVTNCNNYGNITGTSQASGIGSSSNVSNCANYGNIIETDGKAGGIVAEGGGIIINCFNAVNTIIKGNHAGGIAGYGGTSAVPQKIYNCYNLGAVEGTNVGGITRIHIFWKRK